MKTLTNFTLTNDNGKVTITADMVERQFSRIPAQQTTCLHFAEGNPRWIRHVQMSNEALFVKRFKDGLALDLEAWVTQVANILEPKIAAPPNGKIGRTPNLLKADINSELHPTFQWQKSDKATTAHEKWENIEGATTDSLTIDANLKGKFVRCFAKSDAGPLATPPVAV